MEAFSSKTNSSQILLFSWQMKCPVLLTTIHIYRETVPPSVAKEMIVICFGQENEGLDAKFRDLQIKKDIL